MKHAEPMNLHVPMVNVFNKDGAVIAMTTAAIPVMRKIAQHPNAQLQTISNARMAYAFPQNGVAMAIRIVPMGPMKE